MKIGEVSLLALLMVTSLPPTAVESRPVSPKTEELAGLLPIVFVPGKGGSQIEARVDRTDQRHHGLPQCAKKLDWYRMWMDLWTFFKREFYVALL